MAAVSRAWFQVAHSTTFWTRVWNLRLDQLPVSQQQDLAVLFRKWSSLRHLQCGLDVTDAVLVHAGAQCRLLEALSVADCIKLSDRGFLALAAGASSLRDLDLSGCNVTDQGFKALSQCPQLTAVNISRCQAVTADGLAAVAPHWKRLLRCDRAAAQPRHPR